MIIKLQSYKKKLYYLTFKSIWSKAKAEEKLIQLKLEL